MPELFDLDHIDAAFEALSDDVATHTRAPGAERATKAARRRRTTRLVGGVAALAVVAGGGVGLIQHRADHTVVDPASGLPAPQILTADVLDGVTSGWVSDWQEPTDAHQLDGEFPDGGDRCGNRLMIDDGSVDPVHVGATVFLSGRSLAFARGGVMASSAQAEQLLPQSSTIDGCENVHRSAPADDTEVITATATDHEGTVVFAVVRWHDRVALLGIGSPTPTGDPAIQGAVGQALLAAIQDERTVTESSPVLQGMEVAQSAEATPSAQSVTVAPLPQKKG